MGGKERSGRPIRERKTRLRELSCAHSSFFNYDFTKSLRIFVSELTFPGFSGTLTNSLPFLLHLFTVIRLHFINFSAFFSFFC